MNSALLVRLPRSGSLAWGWLASGWLGSGSVVPGAVGSATRERVLGGVLGYLVDGGVGAARTVVEDRLSASHA